MHSLSCPEMNQNACSHPSLPVLKINLRDFLGITEELNGFGN